MSRPCGMYTVMDVMKQQNREDAMEQLHNHLKINKTPPKINSPLGRKIRGLFNMGPYDLSLSKEFQEFSSGVSS